MHQPRKLFGAVALVMVAGFGVAAPAGAWGSGTAVRSCGTNAIESGSIGGTTYALTRKVSGNCSGPLGATLRTANNSFSGWVNNSSWAVTTAGNPGNFVGGAHRGCIACNLSYT